MPSPASSRPRPDPLRRMVQCLAVLLCLIAYSAQESVAEPIELDAAQVRNMAIAALESGDPGLAIQLAKAVLKTDPKDPLAYYIIARSYARLGDPQLARRAAGYAYRYADAGPARFEAAQLAARMAFAGEQYSLSQLWLRRTAIHAPTEADEERVAQDYKLLRQVNPWSLRLRADLRPSDNVNNGSDTSRNIIDGVPDEGTISGAGLALSGLIGSLDIAPSYRLHIDENSMTSLSARLYVERVSLSGSAKATATDAVGSDFASTYAAVSLSHTLAIGTANTPGQATFDVSFGESWYGGERNYRFARVGAVRSWRPDPDTRFALRANAERRYDARYTTNDARVLSLGADFGKALENGDIFNLALAFQDADAVSINGTYSTVSMRASYTLRHAVGPARLSMGLVMGYTNYDQYLFSITGAVPRTDKSVYGDLTLIFDRYDYAGFVPTLRLRTGRKDSNFSRYSSREVSVSLGVGSKF
ncbi:surface lipoprotein assembly modifier [Sedimentitalea todarodis]|uniref:Surface lipoprotein assembly modifier n=1 Tax=Sedimentitalea todarodis TaxID=1631240 RepID=A0ABU3VF52_9RHOB|nr:surface lipoprotein assembly modifier [Sedimentitalea todarodis]MDU9004796.1 surface lipoprotein assembly modifier [Sedimentitalea todarodis]